MISNLQLPNSEGFDVDTTLTLTRRQTKETLALLSVYPERYRWIQPHTTFDYIAPKDPKMYDLRFRVVRFRISGGCYETVYHGTVSPQTVDTLDDKRIAVFQFAHQPLVLRPLEISSGLLVHINAFFRKPKLRERDNLPLLVLFLC